MKPRIITITSENKETIPHQLTMNRTYADAIEKAGGVVLAVARPKDDETLDALIALADGLLLMGGHDIDPSFYGEENRDCKNIDPERDQLEFALLRRTVAKGIPVLGICRGFQVINVGFGGALYQDVQKELPESLNHDCHYLDGVLASREHLCHDMRLTPDSHLARILGEQEFQVNSLHHQGVKKVAEGFRAVGQSQDGLTEAIESVSHPFVIGVEWHPEEFGDEGSQKIFRAFIEAAATHTHEIPAFSPSTLLETA
jgi:putative glutamine amidotransferase